MARMATVHLRQPKFTYSGCGIFIKNKGRIKKARKKETGDSRYIYQNELDKACFQHVMAYRDFKDLLRHGFRGGDLVTYHPFFLDMTLQSQILVIESLFLFSVYA